MTDETRGSASLSRLPKWAKVLFALILPLSIPYGIYWMWTDERSKFSLGQRICLTGIVVVAVWTLAVFLVSGDALRPTSTPDPDRTESDVPATTAAPPAEPEYVAEPSEVAYATEASSLSTRLGDCLYELGTLLQEPRIGQDDWTIGVAVQLASIRVAAEEARDIQVPAGWEGVHAKWLEGVEGYEWVALNLPNAIDNLDLELMEQCTERLNDANERVIDSTVLINQKVGD